MGFLAVAAICFAAFGAGVYLTQSGDDEDDGPGGGKLIPATVPTP